MTIRDIIWLHRFRQKVESKHGLSTEEVEYVLQQKPLIRFHERGNVKGENLYTAWSQTWTGRYVMVVFILKKGSRALPISARVMTTREKKRYARQKKKKA